jgi:[protein-PII] uridylyltransferase
MSDTRLSAETVERFVASLPKRYRENIDSAANFVHTRLALERGESPFKLAALPSTRLGTTAICLVADDHPSLLATISAALVLHGLDVVDAEMHTRRLADGRREVVDLFWVRRSLEAATTQPLSREELSALEKTVHELRAGVVDVRLAEQRASSKPPVGCRDTVVRFLEGEDGSFSLLEIEAGDRPGLLLAISQALFEQRLQIVSSEVRTREGQIFDRFSVVGQDGKAVSPARRLEVQVAVLSALDASIRRA